MKKKAVHLYLDDKDIQTMQRIFEPALKALLTEYGLQFAFDVFPDADVGKRTTILTRISATANEQ